MPNSVSTFLLLSVLVRPHQRTSAEWLDIHNSSNSGWMVMYSTLTFFQSFAEEIFVATDPTWPAVQRLRMRRLNRCTCT